MRVQNQKNRKKPILITLLVVALLAIGYFVAAYTTQSLWPFVSSETSDTVSNKGNEQKTEDSTAGLSEEAPATSGGDNPADHTPKKYEKPDEIDDSSLTGIISSSSVSDSTLKIRTTINQHVRSGKCTLTLMRKTNGKTVTKTADIMADPSTSTCKGFDVPTSELGSGDWNITINLKSGDRHGKLTGNVAI